MASPNTIALRQSTAPKVKGGWKTKFHGSQGTVVRNYAKLWNTKSERRQVLQQRQNAMKMKSASISEPV